MLVIKRDGRVVKFNKEKIVDALCASYESLHSLDEDFINDAESIADEVEDAMQDSSRDWSVEEIQDLVETLLMQSEYKDVAKAYILYRQERTNARGNSIDDTIFEIVDGANEYWKTENSNKDATLNTTVRDYIAGTVSTDLTMKNLLPKDIVDAHRRGIIHFHKCIVAL